jgi:hypothetical protein
VKKFTRLLRLSDIAIKKGLYIPGLAKTSFYFRRTRVPSLVWLTWDKVLLQPPVTYLLQALIPDYEEDKRETNGALEAAREMIEIARELRLDKKVIDSLYFEQATLILFAQLRHYILHPVSARHLKKLRRDIKTYEIQYPEHYTVPTLHTALQHKRIPKHLLRLFLRGSAPYRKRDRVLFRTSPLQRRLVRRYLHRSKSHLTNQSMGIDVLFK